MTEAGWTRDKEVEPAIDELKAQVQTIYNAGYQQGLVAGLREAGPILAKVCELYEGETLEQILEEFYAQLKLAQQAQEVQLTKEDNHG